MVEGRKFFICNKKHLLVNEGGRYATLSIFWSTLWGIRIWIFGLEVSVVYRF